MWSLTKQYWLAMNKMNEMRYIRPAWPLKALVLASLMAVASTLVAQSRYIDRAGKASFFSSAPLENIEAHSEQVVSILDVKSGEVVASMLMRSFNFRKALMEEHFNENYVESHKYPKAVFKGKITNLADFNAGKEGKHMFNIEGDITLHGVTRPLQVKAEATVVQGKIQAKATFPLRVADFKIEVPRLVTNNIAEVVEVKVSFNYQPM